MIRRVTTVLVALGLTLGMLAPVAQGDSFPITQDDLRAYSIVPPGQYGNITALDLATGNPDHYDDQLELYASLVDAEEVTEDNLASFFHSMQFGPTEGIEDSYQPRSDVTVYRDAYGIPHVYADSMEAASFALGYVAAEDRLWQMDIFRRAATGRLAEFVGPEFLEMDEDTRREGYTDAEVREIFDSFPERFGEVGQAVVDGLDEYTAGINAYISELAFSPEELPVEYAATGNPFPLHPERWRVEDTLQLVVLQLRSFGETAGYELQNAALYSHLVEKHGPRAGERIFEDFVFQNERRSYTSIAPADGRFPSQDLGRLDPASLAIPDQISEMAAEDGRRTRSRTKLLEGLGFKKPASNAIIVSSDRSATGNPLQFGAPQVGYSNPQFFMDIDVHAPGVDFRGPAVPGASALIPLGRGRDYAWTLTTGYSDAVDVRVEKLCDPEGEEVAEDSDHYLFNGECVAMESRNETFIVKPTPLAPGPPSIEQRTFYRTVHGPVFDRGTVNGEPVAMVRERFFWKQELDSIPPFYRWNTEVNSIEDFAAAAEDFTMSFNAHYMDKDDIGYFHVGLYPRRAQGVHPSLPVWGTGEWEWRGRMPYARNPKVVNPRRGFLVNWNNKPAAAWDNMDGIKWGSIHRVQLLHDAVAERIGRGRGRVSLAGITDAIREVSTQDVRGKHLAPQMLQLASRGPSPDDQVAAALAEVSRWVDAGAHRKNRDRDDFLDDSAGLVVFDRWYRHLVSRIFDDVLGPEGYDMFQVPVYGSSMWFDFSSYLDRVLDNSGRGGLARDYCDDSTTPEKETCRAQVVAALQAALTELTEEQGNDLAQWKAEAEWIQHQNLGAGSVPRIPWQNRGTHNHAVEAPRGD